MVRIDAKAIVSKVRAALPLLACAVLVLCLIFMTAPSIQAAEADVTTWTASGTCEWGIDPDGCLWVRPTDGVSGTLGYWSANTGAPWYGQRTAITAVKFQGAVNAATCNGLFFGCSNLTNIDFTGFNTSSATSMERMFNGCSSLENLDVSAFDTSNVTSMERMFYGLPKITSVDVSGFNTSNVKNMNRMFYNCSSLTSLDVSGFNTSKVTNMSYMFYNCFTLTSLDVSGFDTSSVTNMSYMFSGGTPSGPNMSLMGLNPSGFNTGKVTDMSYMFYRCADLASLDLSNWNTSNVTNMRHMFQYCSSLTNLNLSNFDTAKVTDMSNMFNGCSGLTSLDVSSFDTSNVTAMGEMFYECRALTSLDISNFNTSGVTKMNKMFAHCAAITSAGPGDQYDLNLSSFVTSGVTDMGGMFGGCYSLTSVDVSGFDTGNVTTFSTSNTGMFDGCSSLINLDLSGVNTSNVTNMENMFRGCGNLTSLDISGFDTSNVTLMGDMLRNCNALNSVKLGENFSFTGKNITTASQKAILPTPPAATTTQKWIKEDESAGPFTPAELREQYAANAENWAGTWVWQEIPVNYTVVFVAPDGAAGAMANQKIKAAEDGVLNLCTFKQFNHHMDHWVGSDNRTYADGDTIPANRFAVGDTLTLTAVFVENDNKVDISGGEFDLYIHGGETATFSGIPAGTAYQIWEETPDGWVLVEQENTTGKIEPLETSAARFLNKYEPGTVTTTFYGSAYMDNKPAEAGAFTFELLEDGNVIQTVTVGEGGVITFDTITYDVPGTHEYTIREVIDTSVPTTIWDRHEEHITVTITDDGVGNLVSNVQYDSDGVRFYNSTAPGALWITKFVNGITEANKDTEFTFRITLHNENGTLSDGSNYYWFVQPAA